MDNEAQVNEVLNENDVVDIKKTPKFPIELNKRKWKEKVLFEFNEIIIDTTILSISWRYAPVRCILSCC